MSDPIANRSIRDLLLKGGCNFGRAYDIERMIRQQIGRELLEHDKARYVELEEKINILQQAILEFAHARSCGPDWYTRGESGMYQQVGLWIDRGQEAVNDAKQIIRELNPSAAIEGVSDD
jgi:hypothetical protein